MDVNISEEKYFETYIDFYEIKSTRIVKKVITILLSFRGCIFQPLKLINIICERYHFGKKGLFFILQQYRLII